MCLAEERILDRFTKRRFLLVVIQSWLNNMFERTLDTFEMSVYLWNTSMHVMFVYGV